MTLHLVAQGTVCDPRPPSPERRLARTDAPLEALERYLDAVARRCGALAVVIADADGPLAGASTAGHDLRALAEAGLAAVTACSVDVDDDARTAGQTGRPEDLYFHHLREHGRTLHLTSLGARVPRVREVSAAVARILG